MLFLPIVLLATCIELPGEERSVGLFAVGKELLLIAQENETKQILLVHLDDSFKPSKLERIANVKPAKINDAVFLEKKNLIALVGHSLDELRRRAVYICLFDIQGRLLKEQTLAFPGTESWAESTTFNNNSFFLAGGYNTLKKGWFDALLLKLNSNLELVWRRTIGGLSDDWFHRVKLVGAHLLCVGSTESKGRGKADMLIALYDQRGKKIWEKVFGRSNWDKAIDCVEFENKLFILGWTNSYTSHRSGLLIKMSHDGKFIEERLIDLGSDFSPFGICAFGNHLLIYGAVWNDRTRFDPVLILLDGSEEKIHTFHWPNDQTVKGVLVWNEYVVFYGESENEITGEDIYVHTFSIGSLSSPK